MEELARKITLFTSHAAELLSAIIIGAALVRAVIAYGKSIMQSAEVKQEIRLQFGSSVAVGLELLLGADVLSTAVAPSWDDIGKLAAIAILRTGLNYFLEQDVKKIKQHKQSALQDNRYKIRNRERAKNNVHIEAKQKEGESINWY
jgi:uncharacterized membrane protein